MRILILHSRYLSGWASGENSVVRDEERLLSEAGHEVVTWTPEPGPEFTQARLGSRTIWSPAALRHVRGLIGRHRPQILHCHNLFPMLSPAVLRAAKDGDSRVVVTLHNYRMFCRTSAEDFLICKGAVQNVIEACGFVRDKHVQAGFAFDRMHIKPNFCWPRPRRSGAGEYFLYVGRLSAEKDVRALLEAWRSIRAPLILVGDGPDRHALEAIAPPDAEFRGTVTPEEVSELLKRARAVMVPTRTYEGAPRSVIEAYATGVPVIATDLGALPEMIENGVSGMLVPSGRADEWVEAVEILMDDQTSARLGDGAFDRWARLHNPDKGLAELERAYRAALNA